MKRLFTVLGVGICLTAFAGVCAKTVEDPLVHKPGEMVTGKDWNQLVYRTKELERKVAGLQRQVTILHAKLKTSTATYENQDFVGQL